MDALELALSSDMISLVDGAGADLLDRVRALRRKLALELGVVMPPVRTRDNFDLPPATYAIRVNGVEVARGQAPAGTVLALGDGLENLPGTVGVEPVFGLTGKWIAIELRGQAELLGATVVDRSSVIITHLSEIVRTHASRLLGREEVSALTQSLKRSHPVVVEDLTPAILSLGEIQRVLHALLDEGVSVRDLVRIFEALSLAAKAGTEPDRLVEAARLALAPAITASHTVGRHAVGDHAGAPDAAEPAGIGTSGRDRGAAAARSGTGRGAGHRHRPAVPRDHRTRHPAGAGLRAADPAAVAPADGHARCRTCRCCRIPRCRPTPPSWRPWG